MKIKRKQTNTDINSKEKDLELLANKGIVGGSGMALLGGAGLLGSKELEKLGIDITKGKAGQFNRLSKIIIPTGLGIAAYGGYLKYKSKKKNDDNKT